MIRNGMEWNECNICRKWFTCTDEVIMIIEWNSIFLLKIQNQIFESAVDVDLLRYVTLTIYVR